MLIVGTECTTLRNSPIDILPLRVRKYFFGIDNNDIYEIRLRCGRPLSVLSVHGRSYLTKNGKLTQDGNLGVLITRRDIDEAVEILTNSSLYSYKDEIKNGFITAQGGHRVGICGTMTEDGEFIADISGLNYRYAREFVGISDKVVGSVYNGGNVKSTLIVSPPGCGKTTFLRDLIRQISNLGINVSVVDERGEIGAVHEGECGFDLGRNTDIMSLCNKKNGMKLMLRTMSPGVIAVDEFNQYDDCEVICDAATSGVSVFGTVHCGDWKKDISKKILAEFNCVVVLSDRNGPGTLEEFIHV